MATISDVIGGMPVADGVPQPTTIELGHASDTTISRLRAAILAVEGLGVPLIIASNAAVAFASTNAESTVYSFNIPAGVMGTDGAVRFPLRGHFLQNTGVNRTFTLNVKTGGTTRYGSVVTNGTTASRRPFSMIIEFQNTGATNTNILIGSGPGIATSGAPSTGNGTDWEGAASGLPVMFWYSAALTEDTTAAVAIAVTITMSVSSASMTFDAFGNKVELLP